MVPDAHTTIFWRGEQIHAQAGRSDFSSMVETAGPDANDFAHCVWLGPHLNEHERCRASLGLLLDLQRPADHWNNLPIHNGDNRHFILAQVVARGSKL